MISEHALEVAVWGIIPIKSYRGVLVEKIKFGYKVLGKTAESPYEVDKIIDEANQSIQKSLK